MANLDSNNPYSLRQAKLNNLLISKNIDALVLNPGASFFYLTGLRFNMFERPVVAIFTDGRPPVIVVPELEAERVKNAPFSIQIFPFGEDPQTWPSAFQQAFQSLDINQDSQVGIEPKRLRLLEFNYLEEALQRKTRFISAQDILASLRIEKDNNEIMAMRKAVIVAQEALDATLTSIILGATEREVAAELTIQLLKNGSDPELPFPPIVASGPNSANPHATPTDRPLSPGDLLVIDWGATINGYMSDLTRTFAIKNISPKFRKIACIVEQANNAARIIAQPGITAEQVDQAARTIIMNAGYGNNFMHRTGHGIGLDAHEEPYIYSGNTSILAPGMVFTVEPGIYLHNEGGVRIEDNIVITPQGAESLSDIDRSVIVIE